MTEPSSVRRARRIEALHERMSTADTVVMSRVELETLLYIEAAHAARHEIHERPTLRLLPIDEDCL